MARSLGSLTIDLLLKSGSFETDMGRAARLADKEAKAVARSMSAMRDNVVGSIAGFVGAFASVGAAVAAFNMAVNQADRLDELSAKLGISTEKLSAWGYAAKMTGTDLESVNTSLDRLSKSAAAAMDASSKQGKVFEALGISVKDATGQMKQAEELLPEIATAFKGMNNSTLESATAMELFGKSGAQMLEFLNLGGDGLDKMGDKAKQLGIIISGDTASAAAQFKDELDNMKAASQGVMTQIAAGLLPVMTDLAASTAEFASEGEGAAAVGRQLGTELQTVASIAAGVANAIRTVTVTIAELVNQTSSWYEIISNIGTLGFAPGTVKGGMNRSASGWGQLVDTVKGFWSGGKSASSNPFANVQGGSSALLQGRELELATARVEQQRQAEERLLALYRGEGQEAPKRVAAAHRANTKAKDEAADAARKLKQAEEAATASRMDALRTLEDWTAQLAGPASEAALRYDRMEDDLNAKLGEGAITAKEYANALGLIQQMRQRDPALMSAQSKAAEAYAEDMKRQAEDLEGIFIGAATSATRAFGDFFARGFKGAKDFVRQLKDTFKRMLSDLVSMMLDNAIVRPMQNWLQSMFSGMTQGAGGTAQAGMGNLFGNLGSSIVGGIKSLFGFGGSASQGIAGAVEAGTSAGYKLAQSLGVAVPGGVQQVGGILLPGGQVVGGGAGAGFSGISPWMGALGGAAMGWGMGGDTPGKIGGALAGGTLAYTMLGAGGGLAAGAAGMAAGGLFGGVSGMLGALGPAGWAALAAIAINKISGGKLFGTKFKTESASQQFGIADNGAFGSQSTTEVRQKSFFRGRQWKTTTTGLDAEAMAAVNELFATISKTIGDAAGALGVEVPAIVGGTFKREFDSKGNLTREFGSIAGRVYNEAQEAFAERLLGENLLAVAKQAGSAAELEQLANAYRGTGKELQEFATLALAVQSDLKSANGLWKQAESEGVMTRIVQYIEGMARAGESLADAYARVAQTMQQYGDLIGGVKQQIAVSGLNAYQKAQLDQVMVYRAQVKQANELAKALGLSGARAEDLAAIEQLHAINMAALTQQYSAQADASRALAEALKNQQWLQDLDLSDLSPLRDDQKLAKSMELLRTSVAEGDYARSQDLAKQALNFGRDLYASGADYTALYNQVTGLVGSIVAPEETMEQLQGLTNEQLATLADLMTDLPTRIAQELAKVLTVAPPPATVDPALPPAPVPAPPSAPPGGGGGGGYYDDPRCVAGTMLLDDGTAAEDASAGDVHATHDPLEGFRRHGIRVRGEAVLQPCVRIVTESGAALVCSRSTPFTDPAAPADLPEFSTLAPDMLGKRVRVLLLGVAIEETVTEVEDAGDREVIPLDFGGRSFPAGEARDALVYSHNMMKSGGGDIGALVPLMAELNDINRRMLAIEQGRQLDALNGSTRASVMR